MWMNEHEIDEALGLVGNHLPEYLPYVRFLSDWRDTVNANSDGWPYWKAGARCASTLMKLVARVVSSIRGRGDSLPSKKEFERALTPIKSCATRHKLPSPALRSEEEATEKPAGLSSKEREDIARLTLSVAYSTLAEDMPPEKFYELLSERGDIHELMEVVWPETEELEGMEYASYNDEFDGLVVGWLEEIYARNQKEKRRRESRG